jgi:hypothetical protein
VDRQLAGARTNFFAAYGAAIATLALDLIVLRPF